MMSFLTAVNLKQRLSASGLHPKSCLQFVKLVATLLNRSLQTSLATTLLPPSTWHLPLAGGTTVRPSYGLQPLEYPVGRLLHRHAVRGCIGREAFLRQRGYAERNGAVASLLLLAPGSRSCAASFFLQLFHVLNVFSYLCTENQNREGGLPLPWISECDFDSHS